MPVRIAARAIPAQVASLRLEGQFFPLLPHGHIHGFRTAGVHDGHDLPDDVNGILRILRNHSLFRVPCVLLQKLQVHCFLIFQPIALRLLLRVGQWIGDIGEERILRPSLRNIPAVKSVAVQFTGFQIPLPHVAGGVILAIGVQRAEAFDVAKDMVLQCPALLKRIKIVESQKRLVYLPTRGIYQVLSSEVASKYGYNVHACIFDELLGQPNRKLFDVMTKGSGAARKQPLNFVITTAGSDKNSICYEVHSKALDILEGRKHDSTFYPVVYSTPTDADWTDPKVWKAVNPSLGKTVDIEYYKTACESAKQNPAEEMQFRQFHLCQWTSATTRWMPMDKWDACAYPVDPERLRGRVCYGGLDLSSTTDITAFVLVFPPEDDDGKYEILPFFWLPEDSIDLRVRRDHVPYDTWAQQGLVYTTEGNVIHYGYIEEFIEELGTKYNIREIAFDRWGAVQMTQNLEGLDFTVVPFGQGYKDMSPPTKELLKLTLEGKLAHGGHPVLRWMVDNVTIRSDPAGNIKADKEKSTEKIDGAIATIMALDRAIRHEGDGASVYDERGLLFI